ncbi:MAG: NUDIX domain-containing protein, partial [Rhodospirillales bacterium]
GAYTAAAIAAIAFARKATVVDGNVERVVARLYAVETPLPRAKAGIRALAASLTPENRPGDFAQGLMDLGAAVCVPGRPRCGLCPLARRCRARAMGIAAALPARAAKKPKPTRRGVAFWIERPDGAVLLRRRPAAGLLGGMMELPSTEWREGLADGVKAAGESPVKARFRPLGGAVRHEFTHFTLELSVLLGRAAAAARAPSGALWCPADRLGDHALPTLMKKIARYALTARGAPPD